MEHKPTKVIVFGATGAVGSHLVQTGLMLGHNVSAFVRNRAKLLAQRGNDVPDNLRIIVGDARDEADVSQAMLQHSACVNAAGNPRDSTAFLEICQVIVSKAQEQLDYPKRLWLFGGVAALDFPQSDLMGVDLPLVPARFRTHKANYHLLQDSDLDWSLMCPGQMVINTADDSPENVQIFHESMVFPVKRWVLQLPTIALTYSFFRHLPKLVVPFESVAYLVMSSLDAQGPHYRKRVGIAAVSAS